MDTFNKKSLCVALAATGVLGVAGIAQAVNVSADGLGNVLIYPYYTVNKDINGNSYNTLMSIVNTTGSTKAVKVRFREGRASHEVLDFNVFLSPLDVWTASIVPAPVVSGSTDYGAHITTADKSCTIPAFPAGGVSFRTLEFAGETGDNSVNRTREGYFEVFEMATYTAASVVGVNSKHGSSGVPADCSKVNDTVALAEQQPPSGGLFGNAFILSPAGGGMFSMGATALANFRAAALYETTGSDAPTYGNADPVSNTIVGSNLLQTTWGAGVDAVTAVLMANTVTNEYTLEAAARSQSNWIVTFPTKNAYVTTAAAALPFTQKYVTKVGGCENFYGVVLNREEASPQVISGTDFSPQPGPAAGPTLCWEAQSIGFGSTGTGGTAHSNVFGSSNHAEITTPYLSGWVTLGFNNASPATEHILAAPAAGTTVIDLTGVAAPLPGQNRTYLGLPVVGFGVETFENPAISVGGKTYLSTFGATIPHHYVKAVQ